MKVQTIRAFSNNDRRHLVISPRKWPAPPSMKQSGWGQRVAMLSWGREDAASAIIALVLLGVSRPQTQSRPSCCKKIISSTGERSGSSRRLHQ